jgi:hypothetical protein
MAKSTTAKPVSAPIVGFDRHGTLHRITHLSDGTVRIERQARDFVSRSRLTGRGLRERKVWPDLVESAANHRDLIEVVRGNKGDWE